MSQLINYVSISYHNIGKNLFLQRMHNENKFSMISFY